MHARAGEAWVAATTSMASALSAQLRAAPPLTDPLMALSRARLQLRMMLTEHRLDAERLIAEKCARAQRAGSGAF